VTCERIQTQDLHEEPSFLSKRQSHVAGWRVALENHGAHPAEPDGSVVVSCARPSPWPRDDRIEVEVESESARTRDRRSLAQGPGGASAAHLVPARAQGRQGRADLDGAHDLAARPADRERPGVVSARARAAALAACLACGARTAHRARRAARRAAPSTRRRETDPAAARPAETARPPAATTTNAPPRLTPEQVATIDGELALTWSDLDRYLGTVYARLPEGVDALQQLVAEAVHRHRGRRRPA
jgi:hypothetical protein